MYKEGKVYVPKDDKLWAEIIRLHHDTPVAVRALRSHKGDRPLS